jgi:hypothetical protein
MLMSTNQMPHRNSQNQMEHYHLRMLRNKKIQRQKMILIPTE